MPFGCGWAVWWQKLIQCARCYVCTLWGLGAYYAQSQFLKGFLSPNGSLAIYLILVVSEYGCWMDGEWVDYCPHSSYVLRNGFGERGNYTLFWKMNNGIGMQKYIFAVNTWMSLKTQLLCGFRLFLLKKTVLEFGNAQHFAGCGCILRLFADSLHRTQFADCRIYQIQDYISERPDFFFRCVVLYTSNRRAQPASVWKSQGHL